MNRISVVAACMALWMVSGSVAQNLSTNSDIATVETTADASVQAGKLQGTAETLTAGEPNGFILLRFRIALIEGGEVGKAVVAVHLAAAEEPPSEILIAGVTASWTEGSAQPPLVPPGTLVKTRKLQNGWLTFEVPSEIALRFASGAATSLALTVPEGNLLTVHSHRSGQFMPYLLVRGKRPILRKL